MEEVVGDRVILDLPPVGSPEALGNSRLGTLGRNLHVESAAPRADYIAWEDRSLAQYHFGSENGRPSDNTKINLTQPAINAFTAAATRIPFVATLKSASETGDGDYVMVKDFHFAAPKDENGQAKVNPATGQPFQDIPLEKFSKIDEEIVEYVPEKRRICIDARTIVPYYQKVFDIHRSKSRLDQVVRDMIFRKQVSALPMGLFNWDRQAKLPLYMMLPAQQWFPDMTEEYIKDMAYLCVDVVMDAQRAKRFFPFISKQINEHASRTLFTTAGATGYSNIYLQSYQRPVVTMALHFFRNAQAPMNLKDALQTGMAYWEEVPDVQNNPAGAVGEQPGAATADNEENEIQDSQLIPSPTGGTGDEEAEPPAPGEQPENTADQIPSPPPTHRVLRHHLGHDLTESFHPESGEPISMVNGEDGKPMGALHKDHPMKWVTRMWIQLREHVVWDGICPFWDIPVWQDRNVPIPGRPVSQPETQRLRPLQIDANNVHAAMVDHVAYFRFSTWIMHKDITERITPSFKNGHADPGTIYTFDADPGEKVADKIFRLDPPPMSDAIPKMAARVDTAWDRVSGHAGVDYGSPPPDVKSGRAITALQGASNASSGFKSQYTEEAIYRMVMLTVTSEVMWMEAEDLWALDKSIPLEVLRQYVVPYARNNIIWDAEIELNTGVGQVRLENQRQIREDFAAKLLPKKITRQKLDYDDEECERQDKEEMREEAMIQAEATAAVQPKQQAPQIPPLTISAAFKDLPVTDKNALLTGNGLPGGAGPLDAPQINATPGTAPGTIPSPTPPDEKIQ